MPEAARSTSLDPDLLTAEIGLLFDYLSGLAGQALVANASGHLPKGCATYDDALTRYFPIDEQVRGGEAIAPSDLQFLLELRDYLNGRAGPTTGASIAFSTLVIRKAPEALKGKADAERAYPEWIPLALALRRTMFVLLCLAVVITLTIATLAAYIYYGNSKIENLVNITAQFRALDEEIIREQIKSNREPESAVLPYCSDIESVPSPANPAATVERFHSVAQSHICARVSDLRRKEDLAYENLPPLFPRDDRALPAMLNVLRGYLLPVLMGLLGSMTYVLRRYLRSIGDRLLTPRDLREYIVRLVLGTVFGVAIGFFTSAGGSGDPAQVIANPVGSLGAPALAFLAGYGVEVVFRMLDGLAEQFSTARK